MDTTYNVTVRYWDDQQDTYYSVEYMDVPGPKAHAITASIEQTRQTLNITDVSPDDCQAIPMSDWYSIQADAHKCEYSQGRGACDICGKVVTGSPLWKEMNGVDST